MKKITAIEPALLRYHCDPSQLNFANTTEITEFLEYIGQRRALDALSFGIEMRLKFYHLYASGPSGFGKTYFIRHYLRHIANKELPPSDWCYVNNFQDPLHPIALEFPPGDGNIFKQDMKNFIDELLYAIPALFDSKEYRTQMEKVENKYIRKENRLLNKIEMEANKHGLTILRTKKSYEVNFVNKLSKKELEQLTINERKALTLKVNKIKAQLDRIKNELPKWYKEKHQDLKRIKYELNSTLVNSLIKDLNEKYTAPKIQNYLKNVCESIVESPEHFLNFDRKKTRVQEITELTRFEVNVIVSNDKNLHAPIIFEQHPNYTNLIGQVEGRGPLTNNFTLIKGGSLHQSNGGYLMLEISKLYKDTHAWNSLIRVLLAEKISIEPLHSQEFVGSQLQPEPIPLNNKIILLGGKHIYDQLGEDDDFNKIFQVFVDFETSIDRTDDNIKQFVSYVARIIKRRKLGAFDCSAIASLIEYCIRLANDTRKISLYRSYIVSVLEESRYWANKRQQSIVYKEDVEKAIESKIKRGDKIRKEYYDDILSEFILIDTQKEVIGQINGLSTITLSNFCFGLPTRITAITRCGKEAMIDIHREVHLGGSNYSKGVLILTGYLKGRYVKEEFFYLSASLVLEQTYGSIDGDSSSLAEICAILSSLSNIPIKQSFAVTGSINQLGEIQSVGGLNEKIEGFYDICVLQGLTGEQGVIIPLANVKNLMLKTEVVKACEQEKFRVFAVKTIDEAIMLLTDVDPNIVHARCEETLKLYSKMGSAYHKAD
ncbi:MAG: AAA family ATPase [Proteobacteria bacterium]|nr:AAA family ATPase [Pseudomonadota bacterium]